jgi:hypothetical protein
VHSQREGIELKYEMFSPREDLSYLESGEPFDADPAVARHAYDAPPRKRL